MGWIRVKIRDMRHFVMPTTCPNCLETADTLVPIVRTVGVPFGGSISTRANWPFCARCGELVTRHTRWKQKYAIVPAVTLAFTALVSAALGNARGEYSTALWLLLAAVFVGVIGTLVGNLRHWFTPFPAECLSNTPTVRPIRGGQAFLSQRIFGQFDFKHPKYVEQLLSLNRPENVTVNLGALKRANSRLRQREKRAEEPRDQSASVRPIADLQPGSR